MCPDIEAYIDRAARLAREPDYREQASAAGAPQPACLRTEAFARDFDRFCARAIAAAAVHAASLRVMDEPSLRALVIETARIALADSSPALSPPGRRRDAAGRALPVAGAPVIDIARPAIELDSAESARRAGERPGPDRRRPASTAPSPRLRPRATPASLLAYRNVGGPGGAARSELARLAADATGLDATAGGTMLFYRPTESAVLVSLIEALEAGMPAPLRIRPSAGSAEIKAGPGRPSPRRAGRRIERPPLHPADRRRRQAFFPPVSRGRRCISTCRSRRRSSRRTADTQDRRERTPHRTATTSGRSSKARSDRRAGSRRR